MKRPRIGYGILVAALASALCWQASAAATDLRLFGVRATFAPTYFVLEMRLPALCVRLQAEIPGFIVATAHLLTCDACPGTSRARSWS